MSLKKIYADVKNTVESQKYKVASDVVNINTRIGGLLAEVATLRDALLRIKADNADICDADEVTEIDAVIARADVEAVAVKLSVDPMKAVEAIEK